MCKSGLFVSILRVLQLTHAVEFAITEVDNPIRRQEEAIEDIDRQDPVERAERELRSNPARIPCANECKELPARAKRSFGFILFVGVHRQRKTEADEHPCFQEFCYEHRVSVPFFCTISSRRCFPFEVPAKV